MDSFDILCNIFSHMDVVPIRLCRMIYYYSLEKGKKIFANSFGLLQLTNSEFAHLCWQSHKRLPHFLFQFVSDSTLQGLIRWDHTFSNDLSSKEAFDCYVKYERWSLRICRTEDFFTYMSYNPSDSYMLGYHAEAYFRRNGSIMIHSRFIYNVILLRYTNTMRGCIDSGLNYITLPFAHYSCKKNCSYCDMIEWLLSFEGIKTIKPIDGCIHDRVLIKIIDRYHPPLCSAPMDIIKRIAELKKLSVKEFALTYRPRLSMPKLCEILGEEEFRENINIESLSHDEADDLLIYDLPITSNREWPTKELLDCLQDCDGNYINAMKMFQSRTHTPFAYVRLGPNSMRSMLSQFYRGYRIDWDRHSDAAIQKFIKVIFALDK